MMDRLLAAGVIALLLFASAAQAQEPTCGTSFVTSEKLGLPLATCTLSEVSEDGTRGDPIHVYDVDPDGSETIQITAMIFVELQAAGAYEIHCTDSMEIESLPASGARCPRPGPPEIRND